MFFCWFGADDLLYAGHLLLVVMLLFFYAA
jgi:hypothetical protein